MDQLHNTVQMARGAVRACILNDRRKILNVGRFWYECTVAIGERMR